MRSRVVLSVLIPLSAAVSAAAQTTPQQVTIENTGSTNMPGVKLVVSPAGTAEVQPRDAEPRKANVDQHLCDQLFQDLKSISSLSALPRTHCVKSVSFGSSLFVEFNGERSPDLNCPAAPNSKVALLQKDAQALMDAAHATPRMRPHVFVTTVPRK